jgi:hypothetical protein
VTGRLLVFAHIAFAKAAQSDNVKRYLSQQKRFLEDANREAADGCSAEK